MEGALGSNYQQLTPDWRKQEKEKEPELWKKAGKQGSDTDR